MLQNPVRIAAALALASGLMALLSGCAAPLPAVTPRMDSAFGDSVRQARALQTVDPEAGRKSAAVVGIDGGAAHSVMEEYQKSFREPPRTFSILGIGGTSVGSGP